MTSAARPLMLDDADVRRIFTLDVALASQREAFRALASGRAVLPPRLLVPGEGDSVAFCYAARLDPEAPAVSKFGSVNPLNGGRGLPAVHALVSVLHPDTGIPVAVMDGTAITTLRTAAASAVAVDALAPRAIDTLAIVGTGVQAEAHLAALLHVRRVREVLVVGRENRSGENAVRAWAASHPHVEMRAVDAAEATRRAEVLALCTTSSTPVIDGGALRPGATVTSVGSFAPDRHEFAPDLLRRVRLVVDHPPTAATDCGPVVSALSSGTLAVEDLVGLGDVLLDRAAGRRHPEEIVVYGSVGVGVQDAAAAAAVVAAAGTGTP